MNHTSRYILSVLLILGATLGISDAVRRRPPERLARPLGSIGRQLGEWTGEQDRQLDERSLGVLMPTAYLARTYRRGSASLDLFIAYYAQQRTGENMHSPKNCLPGSGWEIWNYGMANIPIQGKNLPVNLYSIQKDTQRLVVLYWYQSSRRIFANEYLGKLYLVRDAVIDGRTGGSLVRITVPDQPGTTDGGIAFASDLVREMAGVLGSAGLDQF